MKYALFLPVVLALAGCSNSPALSLAKAQDEFTEHDYAAAKIELAAVLKAEPANRTALLLQARTLLALGDGDGAATALNQLSGAGAPRGELAELAAEAALLRRAPDVTMRLLGTAKSPEAERLRALALIQQADFAGAQQRFEAGLTAGGNARLFADYARFRLISGDIAGADELGARAAKADANGIDTLLINALLALRHGDLNRALAGYTRAASLYPASVAALLGRAGVLGDLGRADEMQKTLVQAATAAPGNMAVAFLRAKAAQGRKDWAGVRAVVQPVESNLGKADPIRQLYGEALLQLGQPQLAIAQLQSLAAAAPASRELLKLLAQAQLAGGDAPGAAKTLRPLADAPAARADELALMSTIATAMADPAAAGYAARAQRPTPEAMGQDLSDADGAMRAGNWAGAVQAYERVLASTDGRNVMVLNNIAYAQMMLGNFAVARGYIRRADVLAPENPNVIDTKAWLQLRSGGNVAQAKQELRRAAALAPNNKTIQAHVAEAERTPG